MNVQRSPDAAPQKNVDIEAAWVTLGIRETEISNSAPGKSSYSTR